MTKLQLYVAALSACVVLVQGCKNKIGDSCAANVDCATDGTRVCDLASPGGYCTIPDCNGGRCPKEAICVAFYPEEFLTESCNPGTEDLACSPCDPTSDANCNALCDANDRTTACQPCDPTSDEGCNASCDPGPATDDCLPDERCLGSGVCARMDTERKFCMRKCSSNDDCRSDYYCARTGTGGTERVPKENEPYSHVERGFCAPKH